MSLTLGKSFDRQYKMRLPFKDFFYDVGVFYNTQMNFNLFDIQAVLKYNSDKEFTGITINMYKNIEISDFCHNCLNLGYIDNRLSKFNGIKEEWLDDVYCKNEEKVKISANNYLRIFNFKIKNYNNNVNDFIYLLVERKNYLKKYRSDKIVTTLSGLQISTPASIEYFTQDFKNFKTYNEQNDLSQKKITMDEM